VTSREARKREARSLIVGAIGAVGALLILLAMVEAPATMDPQALASALSTIAQVAAALAALIGVLGLWRLDRLREEQAQILQLFRAVKGGDLRDELIRYGDESYVREVRSWVEAGHVAPESAVARAYTRWGVLPGRRRQLLRVLLGFLRGMLALLALAIIGLLFVDTVKPWAVTPWLLGFASLCLGSGPAWVVWQATRYHEVEPGW
jgi:hypothetical protein